jgi:hypothetical protein
MKNTSKDTLFLSQIISIIISMIIVYLTFIIYGSNRAANGTIMCFPIILIISFISIKMSDWAIEYSKQINSKKGKLLFYLLGFPILWSLIPIGIYAMASVFVIFIGYIILAMLLSLPAAILMPLFQIPLIIILEKSDNKNKKDFN